MLARVPRIEEFPRLSFEGTDLSFAVTHQISGSSRSMPFLRMTGETMYDVCSQGSQRIVAGICLTALGAIGGLYWENTANECARDRLAAQQKERLDRCFRPTSNLDDIARVDGVLDAMSIRWVTHGTPRVPPVGVRMFDNPNNPCSLWGDEYSWRWTGTLPETVNRTESPDAVMPIADRVTNGPLVLGVKSHAQASGDNGDCVIGGGRDVLGRTASLEAQFPVSPWKTRLAASDFFTNYGNYMPRTHCLRNDTGAPDWPWISALLVLHACILLGYLRIFLFWRRCYNAERETDRDGKLMQLAWLFFVCAASGYGLSAIMFFWPAYRLLAFAMLGLAIVTWRFGFDLEPLRQSLAAHRLQRQLNELLERDKRILEQKNVELANAHKDLECTAEEMIRLSRHAGMAEVATGVLHNVGNVLTSVNVSANLAMETLQASPTEMLSKAAAVLEDKKESLPEFLTTDHQGRYFPQLLSELAKTFAIARESQLNEFRALISNVEHIREIVNMQQTYAQVHGTAEQVSVVELMQDALKINDAGLLRHHVVVEKAFEEVPLIFTERHKILQILVNLISNAKYALSGSSTTIRKITLIVRVDTEYILAQVCDNGVGIPPESISKIFAHGFTTKKEGHGFGLHSSALNAQDVGGSLTVQSDGVGQGATFTLRLPIRHDARESKESGNASRHRRLPLAAGMPNVAAEREI